ncbi:MAG: hypothetical protein U0794_05905 [Isosphaeraceae bacterium]
MTRAHGRHRDDFGRWFGNNNPSWGWVFLLSEEELRRSPSFAAPDPAADARARYAALSRQPDRPSVQRPLGRRPRDLGQ